MATNRDFLGLLCEDTVKHLKRKSDNDVGMKNKEMRKEIKNIWSELTDNCVKVGSENTGTKVKEDIVFKQENYSLSVTIRRLAAGFDGTTSAK